MTIANTQMYKWKDNYHMIVLTETKYPYSHFSEIKHMGLSQWHGMGCLGTPFHQLPAL